MADDLDDQWAPASDKDDDNENSGGELSTAVATNNDTSSKQGDKRKKAVDDGEDLEDAKKKKKKRKNKTTELQEAEVIPLTALDLISCMEKHWLNTLTAIEKEEAQIQESNFAYCNDLTHTANSFLEKMAPKWKKMMTTSASEEPGTPLMLLVCPAALRAASLNRDIQEFKRGCRVAKLFAKHMKLAEQEKFLKKGVIHMGIGTPNRIQALVECGALKLTALSHVVLDWSWRDSKLRRLADVPEVRDDTFKLLTKHLIPLVRSGKTKISLM